MNDDVNKAGLLCLLWLMSCFIGALKGDIAGWTIIKGSTGIFATIVYLSYLRDHYLRELRKQRRHELIHRMFLAEMAEIERSDEE